MKNTRQGRVNRDPQKIRKVYQLEDINQGQQILQSLGLYRLLSNQQVGELLFRGLKTSEGLTRSDKMFQKAANLSLNRLIDAGLVTRVGVTLRHRNTQNKYMTHLNLLTQSGAKTVAEWLAEQGDGRAVRWAGSLKNNYHQTEPNHLVAINDALIHLTRAVWSIGGDVVELYTDAQLKTYFKGLIPDFLAIVEMPSGRVCPLFGEVDTGSMTGQSASAQVRDWTKKIQAYGAYLKHQYGDDQFFYQLGFDPRDMAHPLVLTLTAKDGRLQNIVNATRTAGGGNAYWHTTLSALYDNPKMGIDNWLSMTKPIWYRPHGNEPVSLSDHLIPPDKTPS